MSEVTTIEQIALDYLFSELEILPDHHHLFEVVGTTCFENNECMVNVSIVGLVGEYWNVFVDSNTGEVLPGCEFSTDCKDLRESHQYSHLPDYLNQLLDQLTAEDVIKQMKRR